jgi:hypothetical protein
VVTERQIIEEICAEVSETVAKRIRKVHRSGRHSRDPNYWANVMLRECWREDHGSYDEWDRVARARGVDPLQFGKAR